MDWSFIHCSFVFNVAMGVSWCFFFVSVLVFLCSFSWYDMYFFFFLFCWFPNFIFVKTEGLKMELFNIFSVFSYRSISYLVFFVDWQRIRCRLHEYNNGGPLNLPYLFLVYIFFLLNKLCTLEKEKETFIPFQSACSWILSESDERALFPVIFIAFFRRFCFVASFFFLFGAQE